MKSRDFHNIINNWVALVLLKGGNSILPLVLTPYLIFTLGIEGFGILSFAMAVNVFFRALVSYGFDLTATKMIAEASDSPSKVSEICQDVICAKLVLLLFCLITLFSLVFFVPIFKLHEKLLFSFFLLSVADVFFPTWLYQGMQKMKAMTFFKLLGRFVFVGLTMLVVKSTEDIIYVPLFEGGVGIITSLISLFWGVNKFSIDLKLSTCNRVKAMLKDSFYVFLSKITVLFYTRFNIILLGFMTSPTVVGHYSVAERIYTAIREMFNPFIQAIFPYLSKIKVKEKHKYIKAVRISLFFILTALSILSILLYVCGDSILYFLLNENNEYIQNILSVFSICLIFAVGSFLSTVLVMEGKGKVLSKVTSFTVIINLIIVYPLIHHYEAIGLVFCFLIVQIAHFIMQLTANSWVFKSKDKEVG